MTRTLFTFIAAGAIVAGSGSVGVAQDQQQQQGQQQQQQQQTSQDPSKAGQTEMQAPPWVSDAEFVKQAWLGGRLEVELSEVAWVHAENDAIQDLARAIAQDHRDANAQLHMIADRLDIELPDQPKAHDDLENKFEELRGAAFDRAYLDHMVTDHEKAIALFTQASKSAKDVTIRTFAESTLPKLREHLKRSQDLRGN